MDWKSKMPIDFEGTEVVGEAGLVDWQIPKDYLRIQIHLQDYY